MKLYRLYHRIRKEFKDVEAESPQEACKKAGWEMDFTWVREKTPVIPDPTSESGHRGGGWKSITPREVN